VFVLELFCTCAQLPSRRQWALRTQSSCTLLFAQPLLKQPKLIIQRTPYREFLSTFKIFFYLNPSFPLTALLLRALLEEAGVASAAAKRFAAAFEQKKEQLRWMLRSTGALTLTGAVACCLCQTSFPFPTFSLALITLEVCSFL